MTAWENRRHSSRFMATKLATNSRWDSLDAYAAAVQKIGASDKIQGLMADVGAIVFGRVIARCL